jgi:nicotinamidase-related amidase
MSRSIDRTHLPLTQRLVDAQDSILAVIDVQEGFLSVIDGMYGKALLERVAQLARCARWLEIPIIATVETPEDHGGLHPALAGDLQDVPILRKEVFGLGDDEHVVSAFDATGRRSVMLTGTVTEACVAQSAFTLIARGYEVACVADAVASREERTHELGLERMRQAGVTMLSTSGLRAEWLRTVDRFRQEARATRTGKS